MTEAWPFDQPENCAVISLRQIMLVDAPVLLVAHNEEDHGWQFLSGGPMKTEDMVLVLFNNVLAQDASLFEIADLPPGWQARRASVGGKWMRERTPPEGST